jgi:hypothetical protein
MAPAIFYRRCPPWIGNVSTRPESRFPFGLKANTRRPVTGQTYNRTMDDGGFFTKEFTAAIIAAGARARLETLQAGVPVFYRDRKRGLDIMEQPDGRKFEISFIPGAPGESNYRVVRELDEMAS